MCLYLGKTWLVLNMLLHEDGPYLGFYEKILVISGKTADVNGEWHKLARRMGPDKFILKESITEEIFEMMRQRKNKKLWLVIVDDNIDELTLLSKQVNLALCRHDDSGPEKPRECCHFWVVAQFFKQDASSGGAGIPPSMRGQFQFTFVIGSKTYNRKELSQLREEGLIPSSWTMNEILKLGAEATKRQGMWFI